jgi:Tol biopolymer transport system component
MHLEQFAAAPADESTRQMQGGHRSIWTVNADGSGLARVGGEPNESYRMPAWSSDGQRIVHVRYPPNTNGREIYIMNRDGTNAVRVTTNTFDDAYPRFSPDGTLIAFERLDSRGVPQIWIMNADGTAEEQLTIHGGTRAAWSNDGSSIIYSRYDPRSAELGNGVLWRHDLGSHAETQMSAPWPSTCP